MSSIADTEQSVLRLLLEIAEAEKRLETARSGLLKCKLFNPLSFYRLISTANEIRFKQLESFLSKHRIDMSKSEAEEFYANLNRDNSKYLSKPQFVDFLMGAEFGPTEARKKKLLDWSQKKLEQPFENEQRLFVALIQQEAANIRRIQQLQQDVGIPSLSPREIESIFNLIGSFDRDHLSLEDLVKYLRYKKVAQHEVVARLCLQRLNMYSGQQVSFEQWIDGIKGRVAHEADPHLPQKPDQQVNHSEVIDCQDFQANAQKEQPAVKPKAHLDDDADAHTSLLKPSYRLESAAKTTAEKTAVEDSKKKQENPITFSSQVDPSNSREEDKPQAVRISSVLSNHQPTERKTHDSQDTNSYMLKEDPKDARPQHPVADAKIPSPNFSQGAGRSHRHAQVDRKQDSAVKIIEHFSEDKQDSTSKNGNSTPEKRGRPAPAPDSGENNCDDERRPSYGYRKDQDYEPAIKEPEQSRDQQSRRKPSSQPLEAQEGGSRNRKSHNKHRYNFDEDLEPDSGREEQVPTRKKFFQHERHKPTVAELSLGFVTCLKMLRHLEDSKRQMIGRYDLNLSNLFEQANLQGKRRLNLEDFDAFLRDLGVACDVGDLRRLFLSLDRDEDGYLGYIDFCSLFLPQSPVDRARLINQMSTLHQNKLSHALTAALRDCLYSAVHSEIYLSDYKQELDGRLYELFDLIDAKSTGSLTLQDFKDLCERRHFSPSKEELDHLLTRLHIRYRRVEPVTQSHAHMNYLKHRPVYSRSPPTQDIVTTVYRYDPERRTASFNRPSVTTITEVERRPSPAKTTTIYRTVERSPPPRPATYERRTHTRCSDCGCESYCRNACEACLPPPLPYRRPSPVYRTRKIIDDGIEATTEERITTTWRRPVTTTTTEVVTSEEILYPYPSRRHRYEEIEDRAVRFNAISHSSLR